jgi:hypothetical protein
VTYADMADGGRITYTSSDLSVIDALHQFGVVQTTDHTHGD